MPTACGFRTSVTPLTINEERAREPAARPDAVRRGHPRQPAMAAGLAANQAGRGRAAGASGAGECRRGSRLAPGMVLIWALLGLGLLPDLAVGQPSEGAAGTVSTLRRSEDVLSGVMERLDQAGLDCLRCTWRSTVAPAGGDVLQVEVRSPALSQVRSFLTALASRWSLQLLSFNARPDLNDQGEARIRVSMDLALAPGAGSMPTEVESLLQKLGRLPFFAMSGPAPTEAQVFGCRVEPGRSSEFQLIAPALDHLLEAQTREGFPGWSRSLSRTDFAGQPLFTIECTDQAGGMAVAELIALFKTLAGAAGLREITVPRGTAEEGFIQATLDITGSQWAAVGEILGTGFNCGLVKLEANGEPSAGAPAAAWACTLLLRRGAAQGFPAPEVGSLLGAAWPPALKGNLQLLWLPSTLRLLAVVGGESDVTSLKAVGESLGLTYLGPQSRESLERNAMVVAFGRQAPPLETTPGPPPPGVAIGEEIDTTVTQAGPQISVRLEFSEIPALLERLRAEGKGIVKISLDCQPPDRPVLSYILRDGSPDVTARLLRQADLLVRLDLPWNRPLSEAERGLVLHGFTLDTSDELVVRGATMKSRLIFTDLFPKLQAIPGLDTPFFREGKYSDHAGGRLMRFVVTAPWTIGRTSQDR